MYGKIRNHLKGVRIRKKRLLDVYTGYLFVSCVALFTGLILIFWCIGYILFLGFALRFVQISFQLI